MAATETRTHHWSEGGLPATALEAIGPRAVEVRIGDPGAGFGLELLAFQLDAAGQTPADGPGGAAARRGRGGNGRV